MKSLSTKRKIQYFQIIRRKHISLKKKLAIQGLCQMLTYTSTDVAYVCNPAAMQ